MSNTFDEFEMDDNPSGAPGMIIHGFHGAGKTTLAAMADKVFFIRACENGFGHHKVNTWKQAHDFATVVKQIRGFAYGKHDYKTLAIDTIGGVEKLAGDHYARSLGADHIEDEVSSKKLSFQRGHTKVMYMMAEVLGLLDVVKGRGITVLLLAHTMNQKIINPTMGEYQKQMPALHTSAKLEGTGPTFSRWADLVGFIHTPFIVKTEEGGFGTERKVAKPDRTAVRQIILNDSDPAIEAKNRYFINGPINCDWATLWNSIYPIKEGE